MVDKRSAPHVRPTLPGDVPEILALIGQVYAEYGCVLDTDDVDKHLLDPGPYFRARGGEFWVLEHHGEIKATVAVQLYHDEGELKALYVHSSLRRQGWGRQLSELAIDYTRQAGKPRMILWSDTRFLEAHRLYQAMGFKPCGQRELHDINNTTEHGFALVLPSIGQPLPDAPTCGQDDSGPLSNG